MRIDFVPECWISKKKYGIEFLATANGEEITCFISHEAISHFGTGDDMQMFNRHRPTIQKVALRLIDAGRVIENELVITESDVACLV